MHTATQEDELMAPQEAGKYLGIQPQTLARWRCTGRYGLKFLKVGAAVKYRRSDLDAWLQSRECGGEKTA
jgi:excisionase family DNA binding protein